MKSDKDIPITRAVGRFFGHLWHATTKPVAPESETHTVSRGTQEARGELDGKPVTLRRTTIEEIEIRDDS